MKPKVEKLRVPGKMLQILVCMSMMVMWSMPNVAHSFETTVLPVAPIDPNVMGREFLMPILSDIRSPDLRVAKDLGYSGDIKADIYNIRTRHFNPEESDIIADVYPDSIILSSSNLMFDVTANWRAEWWSYFWSTNDAGTIEYTLDVETMTVEYAVERDGTSASFRLESCLVDMELSEPNIVTQSWYSDFYAYVVSQYDQDLVVGISDEICDLLDPAKSEAVANGLNNLLDK